MQSGRRPAAGPRDREPSLAQHFGRGIVATPNDFGTQGEKPTHPELLRLARDSSSDGGWKLKRLHREIMLSATYMQSGATKDEPKARS
jgi:hypothetical protein